MADIKSCFKSRWGNDGVIIEMDFSQLEVIGAACISNDPMMKKDILDGIDSHSQSASWLNPHSYETIRAGYLAGDPYFEKMRKAAKAPRFELQYGAQANGIARNNNLTKQQAQAFIDQYYGRYSRLKEYQEEVEEAVEASIRLSERVSPSGMPLGVGTYESITGRRYSFYEQENPEWLVKKTGKSRSISPTQIKNYPMQGFATGDVVPEMLGHIHKYIGIQTWRNEFLPINTVHDSIIFDCKRDNVENRAQHVKNQMETVPTRMRERFGITLDMPFTVDVEYGCTWGDMHSDYSKTVR